MENTSEKVEAVQVWSSSLLYCHGVFLSERCFLNRRCSRNSSSGKTKKTLGPFFFLDFRGYVGHFRGASLMLLCPLLPWCFPRTCSRNRSSRRNRKCSRRSSSSNSSSSSSSSNKEFKSFFSLGFRSYVQHFQGTICRLLRPSLPLCFPIREVPFQQNVYQQKEWN